MRVQYSTVLAVMASAAVAAPLNINLGAYSPALVVGDGEISFTGQQAGTAGAQAIVNTLEGATASTNAAVAQGQAIAPAAEAAAAPAQRSSILSEPATLPVPGIVRDLGPREVAEEDEDVDTDASDYEVEDASTAVEPAKRQEGGLSKRQSAGFDRALKYAEAALTKGPKIQLGTEAAGVGILVDNNPTPAAAVNQPA